MPILSLKINQFRNLHDIALTPSRHFNVFYGINGAGKTSILEAIYYLGVGRSFRTNLAYRIVAHTQPHFMLFAEFETLEGTRSSIGLEKQREGARTLKCDGETLQSIAPIAAIMPLIYLSTKSYRYFTDGTKLRRQYLDWGVFHTNSHYHADWLTAQSALKQRNAALKSRCSSAELSAWDQQLCESAAAMHAARQYYVDRLTVVFDDLCANLLANTTPLALRYARGWARDSTLQATLAERLERDRAVGYTTAGPQRADLQVYVGNTPAQDVLSQGQQKLAAYALHLAQGALLHDLTGKTPIYLIDDLPSELDPHKRDLITNILKKTDAQVFITSIQPQDLQNLVELPDSQLFHVKQGELAAVEMHETSEQA